MPESFPQTNRIPTSKVLDALELCYKAGPLSVLLWGPPGCGKSALVARFAEERLGLPLVDIRLPVYDPVDLKGIPAIVDAEPRRNGSPRPRRVTRFFPPDFLPVQPCVIFFDEIASALPAAQVGCQRIILDRSMDGGWRAHPKTFIIAASNRRGDRSGAGALMPSLDNRLVHFELAPEAGDWVGWLLSAKTRDAAQRAAAGLVAAFISFRPDLVHRFDADASFRDVHGFPSYRSWERVCDLIEAALRDGHDPAGHDVLDACIRGAVGVGAGIEFGAFMRLRGHLGVLDDILAGRAFQLPGMGEPDLRWALVGALAARAGSCDESAVWNVVERLSAEGSPDLAVVLVKLFLQAEPSFGDSARFGDWAVKHVEMIR